KGDDLGNGIMAILKYRRGEKDYQDYLDIAKKADSLAARLATLTTERVDNFDSTRKDDILSLGSLADRASGDLAPLKDCAYALVASWEASPAAPDELVDSGQAAKTAAKVQYPPLGEIVLKKDKKP